MLFIMPKEPNVYSVKKINEYIQGLLASEGIFQNVRIRGEIGTLREWNYGIVYFNLKEEDSVISCSYNPKYSVPLKEPLHDGMEVVVRGSIEGQPKKGTYQLKAVEISKKVDVGQSKEELLKLKMELEELGMFDPAYKQPIPKDVKKVGVVTSETGAVINDIINVAGRRNPFTQIILSPSTVSSNSAVPSIVRGIRKLEEYGVDVIIVGRGGGSQEDLWVYNNREVAQAAFDCRVPIISAVGHDIDYTILDLVADQRAATPSQAAEIAVFDYAQRISLLNNYQSALTSKIKSKLLICKTLLEAKGTALYSKNPKNRINQSKDRLNILSGRMANAMHGIMDQKRYTLNLYIEKLKGLSPLDKLNQGYAYASSNGRTLNSIDNVENGDRIEVFVKDGRVDAVVSGKEKIKYN